MTPTATWATVAEPGRTEAPSIPESTQPSETVAMPTPAPKQIDDTTTTGKATPESFSLGTLLDVRLRLRKPLMVKMEREGDSFIAQCEFAEEFGYANSPMGAVDDLRQTIAELYWTLREEQNRLGPNLSNLWASLQQIIEER